MKIGIVTYHRTLNYGAVMQSLATRFILEEMGHEVYYVDYWPDYHQRRYDYFSFKNFVRCFLGLNIKSIISYIKQSIRKKRRFDHFDAFFKQFVYPYCRSVDEDFDVVVYGSDQIWRKQSALGSYNPFYFGDNNLKTKLHVSYAASMGLLPETKNDEQIVKKLVSHLDKVSVREEDLRRLLLNMGFSNIALSLDPTLLLNGNMWDRYLPTEPYSGEKYALLYVIKTNAFDMTEVRKFTESKGLKLKVLQGYALTKETDTNLTTLDPSEFLRLIKNAEYIFSCSFHGLAFSIIYKKQFIASFINNSGRAESLLNLIGTSHRLLSPHVAIPLNMEAIDYVDVQNRLSSAKQESMKYLADALVLA